MITRSTLIKWQLLALLTRGLVPALKDRAPHDHPARGQALVEGCMASSAIPYQPPAPPSSAVR